VWRTPYTVHLAKVLRRCVWFSFMEISKDVLRAFV
jgi:hypothetical protein